MIILGHRGSPNKQCSENTLEAFQRAVELGADGIEFDIRMTRDNEPVIIHDANLHRVAGDAHRVHELSLKEIQEIPLRHGGHVPSLLDVTSTIHAPMILDMEVKVSTAVEPIIAKLKTSAALRERTVISSFYLTVLQRFQKEVPDVRRFYLRERWPLPLRMAAFLKRLHRLELWGAGFSMQILTKARIEELQMQGLMVGTWDRVGLASEAHHAMEMGLDVIIVKNIEAAIEVKRYQQHQK